MTTFHEQGLKDLARACSATGTIIEAHSDEASRVCRVIVEMSDGLRHLPLREATLQLWMADGFIASVSRDGRYLVIDGLIGQAEHNDAMVLINVVAQQIKRYGAQRQSMQAAASLQMSSPEVTFLAGAHDQASALQPQLRR